MIVVGVDPGLDGAFAIMQDGVCIHASKLVFEGKTLVMRHISDVMEALTFHVEPNLLICERVHSTPNDGHVGAFTFGKGFGHIRGFCEGRGWRYTDVRPLEWKRSILKGLMGLPMPAIARIQETYPKYKPKGKDMNKATTIDYVMQKYPHIDICPGSCRLPQDGICDAICVAEYGEQHG